MTWRKDDAAAAKKLAAASDTRKDTSKPLAQKHRSNFIIAYALALLCTPYLAFANLTTGVASPPSSHARSTRLRGTRSSSSKPRSSRAGRNGA